MPYRTPVPPGPLSCDELVGEIELVGDRPLAPGSLPYRRLGRIRSGAAPRLVELTDFGTARDRWAADDTWTEAEAFDHLAMRAALVTPYTRAPIEVGIIVAEREGAELERGMHVPRGQLDVLDRLFAVDELPTGVSLVTLLAGPPLPPLAARAVWIAMTTVLEAMRAGASRAAQRVVPGRVDLELWIGADGQVDARMLLRHLPSSDFAGPMLAPPPDPLAGRLVAVATQLAHSAGLELDDAARAVCRDIDHAALAWPRTPIAPPALVGGERAALADHVQRCFADVLVSRREHHARILEAMPASPTAPARRTRPLER